ncbi:MAG TPA: hypothetical protein VKC62_11565 [Gaiellaceae bacterium]|nr:hypothetical protein [Gaiellaceae bacterium]
MSLDPAIIERYAKLAELKAGSRVVRLTLVGLALGGVIGALPLLAGTIHLVHSVIPAKFGYGLAVAGAAGGAYLGYLIGQSRAVTLRLQAHTAVHQLEVERLIRRLDALRLPMPVPDPAVLAPAAQVVAPPPVVEPPAPVEVPPHVAAAVAAAAVSVPPPVPPPAPFALPPASAPPARPFPVPAEPAPSPAPLHAVPAPVPFSLPVPEPAPSPAPVSLPAPVPAPAAHREEAEQMPEPPTIQLAPAADWQLPPVNAVRTNP